MRYKFLTILILVFILLELLLFSMGNQINEEPVNIVNYSDFDDEETKETTFFFNFTDKDQIIDGEVFFDNLSFGNTTNGKILIPELERVPSQLVFKGKYEDKDFELTYEFPKYYTNHLEYPFRYDSSDLEESILYIESQKSISDDMFYYTDNYHFTHMPIVYKYSEENLCKETKKNKIFMAFDEISNSTNNSVRFLEGENYDILINCYESNSGTIAWDGGFKHTILGEGGINSSIDIQIISSVVNFYPTLYSCGWYPFIELHEILHAMGFYHHDEKAYSIMKTYADCENYYRLLGNKRPYIDEWIVDDLMETYGPQNSTEVI